ncbi:BMP family lipoprotein [Erysipelothrix sp. strain 2 (EsS2-6-Brazil)]|uniref:BMP family lipoprotein n=1 Tax=Erysipelothrix sp. strain 2 (EsS2-6-Brazil) TaxID=2500549 RepID=UPI001909A9E1|nr:BMP family ABC transporter substrate-binding protein [Erysipelothrix sp. strain 2 (EsS2-6-Brazil)]MBK2402319.1 BMP family ABC transporter substrate-binding protein [Erysipelothrix sp. strain 2 (EsS2-6-Brazil)]
MKSKWFIMLLSFVLLGGCSTQSSQEQTKSEVALITDIGTIDDHSFNQESWEGIIDFCKDHNVSYKYYRPENKDDIAFYNEIQKAIEEGGAKVVVLPGFYFESTAAKIQDDFPNVKFILIDALPKANEAGEVVIRDNLVPVLFREEQAAYLAGFVTALEGYTNVGFVGGAKIPAVERYGMGFVKGLQDGAKSKDKVIHLKYKYSGTFEPSTEIQMLGSSWYNEGTEIIFASAGGAGQSIIKAAEDADKRFIGVDVDQSYMSDKVAFSATKGIRKTVKNLLEANYKQEFPGGKRLIVDLLHDGVGLAYKEDRLKEINKNQVDTLIENTMQLIESKELIIQTEHDESGAIFSDKSQFSNLQIEYYR